MSEAKPYPKHVQLASERKRYRRKVAGRKTFERICDDKVYGRPCRVCKRSEGDLNTPTIDPHHIVPRDFGGDDIPENIVPVCRSDHDALHRRAPVIVRLFCQSLEDDEYAYAVTKFGEDVFERVYGIEYERP